MIVNVLFNLLFVPAAVLTPLHTVRYFGAEPWLLVAIELAFFIGMATGGALTGAWGGFNIIALATVVFGLSAIGLGLAGTLWLYLACMAIAGFVVPAFNAPVMSIMQIKVDAEYMGRVFSVLMMLSSITMPIGWLSGVRLPTSLTLRGCYLSAELGLWE